jgi:hypothetical protein
MNATVRIPNPIITGIEIILELFSIASFTEFLTGVYNSPNEEFNVLLIELVVGNEGNTSNIPFCFAEFFTELDGLKKLDTSAGILRLLFTGVTDTFFPFMFFPLNGFILFINSNNMIMIENIIITLYKIYLSITI